MTDFTMRRLSYGAICPAGDCNFPERAEAWGDIDIDNQIPGVIREAKLQPGDVVVDVGGFVGDTAVALARGGCEVYAFEPFFDSFVAMQYNTQVWRLKTGGVHPPIHCFHTPVGNGERVKLVYECPGPNYGMRSVAVTEDRDCIVAMPIDDLRLEKCALMKIDCEGAEVATLLGARQTIARCRPILFVEMYKEALERRGASPDVLEATIRSLGYTLEMWGEQPRWDWFCRPLPVDAGGVMVKGVL